MKKRLLWILVALLLMTTVALWVWHLKFSPTKIAFVNYQITTLGQIYKSNDNSYIKLKEVGVNDLKRLSGFDMVMINGMGLRITEQQRAELIAVSEKTPVMTTMATNPADNVISLADADADVVAKYLGNGGRTNYRSMLNYIRREIDGKSFRTESPMPVAAASIDLIYHKNPKDSAAEDLGFNTIKDYDKFLKDNGLYNEKASRVIVTGSMGEPDDLVAELERTGNMVYPVRNIRGFISGGLADTVKPSAIINMAHGRTGDFVVNYVDRENIPLFTTVYVPQLTADWENAKMGMSGGFLSQSIVMPEIDGAIRPYAVFSHRINDDGLQEIYAEPGRLKDFVQTVNNYISLKTKNNKDKKVAIYYYKGPGQNALTASGLEVLPSLYNLLLRMRDEGYNVDGLPESSEELGRMIQRQGAVLGTYALGAFDDFMRDGNPELVERQQYEQWVALSLRPERYEEVKASYGDFPGSYMAAADGRLAVARLQFGNIVLLPQPMAGYGDNDFKIVHGTDAAPPHTYIASYLWARHGFKADVIMHFGTHGSFEYTPRKQVALCDNDWPDRLIGTTPHLYLYTIGNVGEALIAKRRSYAALQSYLTPPFKESGVRREYRELAEAVKSYFHALDMNLDADDKALEVKKLTVKLGIHRNLELDSIMTKPYSEDEIVRIDNFAEELSTEKIMGRPYVLGVPYEYENIRSSVFAMSVEPIAYSVLALDKLRGKADANAERKKSFFTAHYLEPSALVVAEIMKNPALADDKMICKVAGITQEELDNARALLAAAAPADMMSMMMAKSKERPAMTGDKRFAEAVMEIERTIKNVDNYRRMLSDSPEKELASVIDALNGGYTLPSPGGDPVVNPNVLPTGRNLYGINAEATPSESAWEKGKMLAENTIKMYRQRHGDSIPRKVSYTLWSGEFVETEGATIAQVLYMLGVEPVRDAFGRVTDIRLIPSKELGRPRIDVVVQTSGQLRDLAASRLFLINRAVEMAANAVDTDYDNYVTAGVVESERTLINKGLSPKNAREASRYRVFGGLNGGYGTGIQSMVQAGDRWEKEQEIAETYLNNMGAYYGDENRWEEVRQSAFEAALTNTDAVVQPRQSNTWGALSLDHVYEFMGGLNLAVRNVTGKDPDAYLSDYRNRNHARMQEVKESIGVESRTTIFNPNYISEMMKGEASAASTFAEIVQNTYGWNVMKPKAIDNEMWDEIYNVYVKDKFNLGVQEYFESRNPAALQEITAVMMETARKGLWNATEQQLDDIARLHTELVNKYQPSCSGFVCDNAKLRDFIASKTEAHSAAEYYKNIKNIREAAASHDKKGMVMKKENLNNENDTIRKTLSNMTIGVMLIIAIVFLIIVIRKRRQQEED